MDGFNFFFFFLKCTVCTAVVWPWRRVSHLATLLTQAPTCFSTFALFSCIKPNLSSSRNGDLWPAALCNLSTSRLTVASFLFSLAVVRHQPGKKEKTLVGPNKCFSKSFFNDPLIFFGHSHSLHLDSGRILTGPFKVFCFVCFYHAFSRSYFHSDIWLIHLNDSQ